MALIQSIAIAVNAECVRTQQDKMTNREKVRAPKPYLTTTIRQSWTKRLTVLAKVLNQNWAHFSEVSFAQSELTESDLP